MNRQTWIIAGILSAVFVFGLIGISAWQQNAEMQKLRKRVAEAEGALESAQGQANSLREELAENKVQVEELQKEKEAATAAQHSLEQEMRSALESRDITISELQGKLTVNILDRILFDSGEAVLRAEGEKVLQQIAGILSQYPNRQIHVMGHTDNVPIRPGARNRFASNWELSTARAIAAVRFLCEKAGVDPRRVGAVGYGEFHPVADNSTAEGRAKNRRIALVVLPEELSGAETTKTNAPALKPATNSPASSLP